MWRIILTAVRSISLVGWTRLYSQPPGRLFVWTMWRIHTLFMFSAPQIKTLSCSIAQLCIMLRLSIEAIDVWNGSMMEKYQNDRTVYSVDQSVVCGLCLRTCLLPIPQCHVCFLDSLCLVSHSHFKLCCRVQTSHQMWSLPKQFIWLWGFCTQGNCKTCFSNCSENITYEIQNNCLSLPSERWRVYFMPFIHSSSSKVTFSTHLALILYD